MVVVHDALGAVDQTLQHLESVLAPDVPEDDDSGFYGWVSLPLGEFFAGMDVVHQTILDERSCWDQPSFLDVGCGIGTKLLLARHLGYQVSGVERRPEYAEVARRLVSEADVLVADAFDFDGYGRFDVVYSYLLCRDWGIQRRLVERIVGGMRPGALFFSAGWDVDRDSVIPGSSVWRA